MKRLTSFVIRHRTLLTLVAAAVVIAAIAVAGGAPDIFYP
jgi:hypothetical protein